MVWRQRLEVFWVGAYCRQRTPIHDALDFDDGGVEGFDGKWISLEGQLEMSFVEAYHSFPTPTVMS